MPGFPDPFTTDDDVIEFAHEQGITNFLETGGDYTQLHAGALKAVKKKLDGRGTKPDLVENPSDFKEAAINWFLSKIFAGEKDLEKANWYADRFRFEMIDTRPKIAEVSDAGGQVGTIVVLKRGGIDARGRTVGHHYRRRRPGSRFGGA
ncbi:MAG: hypothetical protein P1V97_31820 [Planctomycetota bacterium]|nr:hypothetical protein [Planctomycetota bacterium]